MADATDFLPEADPPLAEKSVEGNKKITILRPGWRNGRRNGLKIRWD